MGATRKAFGISILAHMLLLGIPLLFLGAAGGKSKTGRDNAEREVTFVPKVSDTVEVDTIVVPGDAKKKKQKKQVVEECKRSYTGIGITIDNLSHIIIVVAQGYPADRAGIQAGTLLVSPEPDNLDGPEGAPVTVTIYNHSGLTVEYTLTREKVCIK